MASQVPPGESHFEFVLRWWAVIVAILTLGYTLVMRLIVTPRAELRRLTHEVNELRNDINALVAARDRQIGDLERSVDKMRDMMFALHANPHKQMSLDMLPAELRDRDTSG